MPPVTAAESQAYIRAFRWNEAEYQRLLAGPVMRDLVKRAIRVESAAKVNASQPHRAGPNTGSVPGHGPAVRTGRLRSSITWKPGRDSVSEYVDVGTAVFYGGFVEYGTTRMAARPYLRPALAAARTT